MTGRGRAAGQPSFRRYGEGVTEDGAPHTGVIARGLHRSFRSVGAVQGMDLDAYPGRVTALVGPNGAGKTTLLLILATLLRPGAGWVRVAGFDPVTAPTEVRARMGWAPDMLGFYDALTVAEYLDVMAAAHGIPVARRRETVPAALVMARLIEQAPARVHTLSRGQTQRLSLARSLIHGPSVLLLDEPAAGLDPRSRIELHDLLRQRGQRSSPARRTCRSRRTGDRVRSGRRQPGGGLPAADRQRPGGTPMSSGIVTVAQLEFRLRLRTGRWRWLLASWLLVLTGIATLIRLSIRPDIVGEEVVD